ncbi:hypothetical protein CR513_30122, partial [Mucuna pruriens]
MSMKVNERQLCHSWVGLVYLINWVVDRKVWNPINLSRGDPYISHLLFGDDLFLFGETSYKQTKVECLNIFCQSLGSKTKSVSNYPRR